MLTRSRPAKPGQDLGAVRELAPRDLDELAKPGRGRTKAVDRFRDSHHMVARLFSTGLRAKVVAERTGYSLLRVTTLYADPAFQELISHYRDLVSETFVEEVSDFAALATANMLKAERQISDRLDEADAANETLPVRELVAISRDAADRFGFGKRQTNVNLNVDFAGQLDRAIKRSGKVIEAVAGTAGSIPATRGSAEGLVSRSTLHGAQDVLAEAGTSKPERHSFPVPAHSSRAGSGGAQVAFETSPSQSKARANGSPVHHQPSVRRI